MASKYPPKNPKLNPIPFVVFWRFPDEIYQWKAFHAGKLIAKAPWKKLCWKQADRFMKAMG